MQFVLEEPSPFWVQVLGIYFVLSPVALLVLVWLRLRARTSGDVLLVSPPRHGALRRLVDTVRWGATVWWVSVLLVFGALGFWFSLYVLPNSFERAIADIQGRWDESIPPDSTGLWLTVVGALGAAVVLWELRHARSDRDVLQASKR